MVGTAYMRWNPQIAEPAHPSFEGPPHPLQDAEKQVGMIQPRMNADKRRLNAKKTYPRSSAFISGPSVFSAPFYRSMTPRLSPMVTACVRSLAPSFARMFFT